MVEYGLDFMGFLALFTRSNKNITGSVMVKGMKIKTQLLACKMFSLCGLQYALFKYKIGPQGIIVFCSFFLCLSLLRMQKIIALLPKFQVKWMISEGKIVVLLNISMEFRKMNETQTIYCLRQMRCPGRE